MCFLNDNGIVLYIIQKIEVNIDMVAFEHKKTVSPLPILWCALVDSNHRPPPCQGDALTKLS